MIRILFVCLGNICRSPTAEAVFRSKLETRRLTGWIECDSAGTAGYHVGEAPDRRASEAARLRGYDMSAIRGRQVCDADFDQFDLILAMDHNNLAELRQRAGKAYQTKLKLLLDFTDASQREVPDPYYGGGEGFAQVLDLVESACDGLLVHLQERAPS